MTDFEQIFSQNYSFINRYLRKLCRGVWRWRKSLSKFCVLLSNGKDSASMRAAGAKARRSNGTARIL